jgi:hypothetical protein
MIPDKALPFRDDSRGDPFVMPLPSTEPGLHANGLFACIVIGISLEPLDRFALVFA